MVSEREECDDSIQWNIFKGYFHSVDECASQCKDVASMFAYGTNDTGTTRCNNDGCRCLCEISATDDGVCTRVKNDLYHLFKINISGDYFVSRNKYHGYL